MGSTGWELGWGGGAGKELVLETEERSEGEFNVSESSGVIKNLLLLQSILLRQVEFAWPH